MPGDTPQCWRLIAQTALLWCILLTSPMLFCLVTWFACYRQSIIMQIFVNAQRSHLVNVADDATVDTIRQFVCENEGALARMSCCWVCCRE